jgi:hypothetical protein
MMSGANLLMQAHNRSSHGNDVRMADIRTVFTPEERMMPDNTIEKGHWCEVCKCVWHDNAHSKFHSQIVPGSAKNKSNGLWVGLRLYESMSIGPLISIYFKFLSLRVHLATGTHMEQHTKQNARQRHQDVPWR